MTPAAPAQEEDALDFGAPDAAEEDAPVAVETKKTETPPQEEEERPILPSEFIAAHKNQTCLIGGIITEAEQRISQKGNPYGRYTIEDYTGSYTLALFGNAYSQFAHMMLKDLYVLITGVIQQKGNGQRWFKEQPDEKAEYEFIVQKVEMLNEAQDKRTDGLNITLALNRLTPELADELAEQISSNKGQGRLHVAIYNPSTRQSVALTSRSHSIHVTPPLYRWLARRRGEGILDFKVVEKN